MNFWIVTPSFNQLGFLQRCVASVEDQVTGAIGANDLLASSPPISVHHHIQDAGSTDGTVEWLKAHKKNSPGPKV